MSKMNEKYAVVIGSMNYDFILDVPGVPAVGETLPADSVNFASGGKGANQATQCAKLGTKTYMLAAVGKDYYGDILVDELSRYGVDTTYIKRVDKTTGMGFVNVLQNGNVMSVVAEGANGCVTKDDVDKHKDLIVNAGVIVLQMEIPVPTVEYIIETASKAGVYIILNAAPAKPINMNVLAKVDCLVVNEVEASYYADKAIIDNKTAKEYGMDLSKKIKNELIITLGSQGSVVYNRKGYTEVPVVKTKAVDTTGAGDSYVGTLAHCFVNEIKDDEKYKIAAAASSVTVSGYGGQKSMPTMEQLNMKTD